MTFQEIQQVDDIEEYFSPLSIVEVENHFSINEKVALPILTSFSFDRSQEIVLRTEKGVEIGKFLFLKNFKTEDIRSLPEEKLVCFFTEYSGSQITEESYEFQYDHILIKKRNLKTYLKHHKKHSSLWGSFFHVDDLPSISFDKHYAQTEINIVKDLKVDNNIYLENLLLSINEQNPFNRFLKLYHLIELQFDMHTAEKIVELVQQGQKEKEISGLLKEYQKEELNRLTSIIKQRCTDIGKLKDRLNRVQPYVAKAKKIFYEYGRESNPLKKADFLAIIEDPNLFSESVIDSIGGYTYTALIPKLSSYWIYRIRSSIAHNKFGEYIMDKNDEEFIVEFGEPLLKEMVIQCFKR